MITIDSFSFFPNKSNIRLLVNAIYLELPIFFLETPETNQIASFISLSIQTANCLMIFYLLFNWRFPAMKVHWIILGLLCSSLIFSIFLGTFWELTLQIGDSSYSIVLFITRYFFFKEKKKNEILLNSPSKNKSIKKKVLLLEELEVYQM